MTSLCWFLHCLNNQKLEEGGRKADWLRGLENQENDGHKIN